MICTYIDTRLNLIMIRHQIWFLMPNVGFTIAVLGFSKCRQPRWFPEVRVATYRADKNP